MQSGSELTSIHHQPATEATTDGSFVALRVWLAGSPWRLTGGWMVLASILAYSGKDALEQPALPLVLALTLAELLWMALWMQLVPPRPWPGRLARRRPVLPYIAPGSPAARLLGWQQPGALAAIVRGGVPLVLLSLLIAYLLSPAALVLTSCAVVLVVLGTIARRAGLVGFTHWLHALLIVGPPMALGISLTGVWPTPPESYWLGGLALGAFFLARVAVEVPHLPLQSAVTGGGGLRPILLVGAGVLAMATVMLFAQQPLALGAIVLLAAAPLLTLARPAQSGHGAFQAWCLLLVMAAAAAIGLGLG